MSLPHWTVFIGVLLLSLVLLGTWLQRLPLSSAMVYLALGWVLGPDALGLLTPDPIRHAALMEPFAEAALLISLFASGLHLGAPLTSRRWWLPLRLASLSLVALVGLVAAVGTWVLGLPLGAAVLLGAILAPTDPVLASGVPAESGVRPDRLGFSLAGEGALNDGAAYPFVLLGLGLLATGQPAQGWDRWWYVDVLWSSGAGLLIGALLGASIGRLVVHLRGRHRQALGLDVFLGLGLIALSHGLAQLVQASGFLAVFASGLALQRVAERPRAGSQPLGGSPAGQLHGYATLSIHSHHASAAMRGAVQLFNGQLEKVAELVLVLFVGGMLGYARWTPHVLWFVPLLLLVLRPLSVAPALWGERLAPGQAPMLAWFGIRGIGSLYYLLLVLRHGVDAPLASLLVSLTLWTVASSIVLHGITARPFMRRYLAVRRRMPRSGASV